VFPKKSGYAKAVPTPGKFPHLEAASRANEASRGSSGVPFCIHLALRISLHKLAQKLLHFGAYFAPHPHIEYKSGIAHREPTELRWRQLLLAQEAFDEAIYVHKVISNLVQFSLHESIRTNIEHV
jgi:hypothetical protein